MMRFGVPFFLCCLLTNPLGADSSFSLETGAGSDPQKAGPLVIESHPPGASVQISGLPRGKTPLTLSNLSPGRILITVSATGYRPLEAGLSLESGNSYRLKVFLDRSQGFLDLDLPGPGRLFLDGRELEPLKDHFYSVPSGKYRYTLSVFGFEEEILEWAVEEDQVLKVKPELRAAPFRVKDLSSWPRVFNPNNPGALGSFWAYVEVTAPGRVTLSLQSAEGEILQEADLGEFNTWSRKLEITDWLARLPDGSYTLKAAGEGTALSQSIQKAENYILPILTPALSSPETLRFLGPTALPAGALWLGTQAWASPFSASDWGMAVMGTLGTGGGLEISAGFRGEEIPGGVLGIRGHWSVDHWGFVVEGSGEVTLDRKIRWTAQGGLVLSAGLFSAGLGGGYVHAGVGNGELWTSLPTEGTFVQGEMAWSPGSWGLTAGLRFFPTEVRSEVHLLGRILLPDTGAVFGLGAALNRSIQGEISGKIRMETGFFL